MVKGYECGGGVRMSNDEYYMEPYKIETGDVVCHPPSDNFYLQWREIWLWTIRFKVYEALSNQIKEHER